MYGDICCSELLVAPCIDVLVVGRSSGKPIWESSGFLLVVHLFAIVASLEVLLGCVCAKGMALLGKPEEPGKGHNTFSAGP